MTMSGSPNRVVAAARTSVISHEDYTLLERLIPAGATPRLEGRVENKLGQVAGAAVEHGGGDPGQRAAGPGRDSRRPPRQLGPRHRASPTTARGPWSCSRRPARIARSGLKPKRTIRFILFSGEEQGLLGSRAYAAAHAAEADSIQAVLVIDNGTGMIVGQALQGRADLDGYSGRPCSRRWPPSGPTAVRTRCKSGTDHLSFAPYGVPSFNFDQHPARLFPHPPLAERHVRQGGRGTI